MSVDRSAVVQISDAVSRRDALDGVIARAYLAGHACHGDLGLERQAFAEHLTAIARKYLGAAGSRAEAACFLAGLHAEDLYLAIACAEHNDSAWRRFGALYRGYVNDFCRNGAPTGDAARELADSVLIDMFFPDRSGRSRIASYDGRSSLLTWLRVIVLHRAINESQRKSNGVEQAEYVADIIDASALYSIESALRAHRYGDLIRGCLRAACGQLTARERQMLLWRYDEDLQLGEIARRLGVHQCTVTRQLERLLKRLRAEVIRGLAIKHCLDAAAIEECVEMLLENHADSFSIFTFIKEEREEFQDAPLADRTTTLRRQFAALGSQRVSGPQRSCCCDPGGFTQTPPANFAA